MKNRFEACADHADRVGEKVEAAVLGETGSCANYVCEFENTCDGRKLGEIM
jgi:hypothetical protein